MATYVSVSEVINNLSPVIQEFWYKDVIKFIPYHTFFLDLVEKKFGKQAKMAREIFLKTQLRANYSLVAARENELIRGAKGREYKTMQSYIRYLYVVWELTQQSARLGGKGSESIVNSVSDMMMGTRKNYMHGMERIMIGDGTSNICRVKNGDGFPAQSTIQTETGASINVTALKITEFPGTIHNFAENMSIFFDQGTTEYVVDSVDRREEILYVQDANGDLLTIADGAYIRAQPYDANEILREPQGLFYFMSTANPADGAYQGIDRTVPRNAFARPYYLDLGTDFTPATLRQIHDKIGAGALNMPDTYLIPLGPAQSWISAAEEANIPAMTSVKAVDSKEREKIVYKYGGETITIDVVRPMPKDIILALETDQFEYHELISMEGVDLGNGPGNLAIITTDTGFYDSMRAGNRTWLGLINKRLNGCALIANVQSSGVVL